MVESALRVSSGSTEKFQEQFEEIAKSNPSFALDAIKKTSKQRKAADSSSTRAEKESRDRERYALELAGILSEAGLPVVPQIYALDDPNKAWLRVFGMRRSKTLRNRLRYWLRFRSWLVAYCGAVWPRRVSDLINYIEDSVKLGCTITLIDETQAALSVLEQVGRVPEGEQLNRDQLWRSHISAWKVELDGRGEPRGPAQPFTVAILIALELVVGDTDHSFYKRLIAWTMLLGVWGCMRTDDIQSVAPESVRVSTRGLSMRLSRSKTTGPGKLHGKVHAFVRRDITITGTDWIAIGVQLLQSDSLIFPRDYLIPAPHVSWTACRKKILEPPQLANHFRMVLQTLGTPKLEDGSWRTNLAMELVPGDLCLFWSGHSPRHFLPQAAAAIGCSKPDRDFLGRWAIGKTGSNAYLITSRQVVERIQGMVLESFTAGNVVYDEGELLDSINEFCEEHQLIGHRIRRRHKTVPVNCRVGAVHGGVEDISDDEELDEDKLESLKKLAVAEFATEAPEPSEGGYFVTVSRRAGFKRLHLVGGCHVHAEKCQQAFAVSSLDGVVFDSACKICKMKLNLLIEFYF